MGVGRQGIRRRGPSGPRATSWPGDLKVPGYVLLVVLTATLALRADQSTVKDGVYTKAQADGAKALWEKFGLPNLKPESPWHGHSLGDWHSSWEQAAQRAAAGDWQTNGKLTQQRTRMNITPETSVREIEDGWDKK